MFGYPPLCWLLLLSLAMALFALILIPAFEIQDEYINRMKDWMILAEILHLVVSFFARISIRFAAQVDIYRKTDYWPGD